MGIRGAIRCVVGGVLVLAAGAGAAGGEIPEEFRVRRERVFEFARPPRVEREGDRITIRFETRSHCDATVAIEDADGRIVRHLASGVLGRNAPPPFQKDSRSQAVVWDGKDDQGRYIDDTAGLTVRVSLGLKPRFERTLFWSPHKQRSALPTMAAAPEGVYVYDGRGVDHLRLFGHDGNYLRTIYPFPADRLKDVLGLRWHEFPQGYRLALKQSGYQQTLLTSGDNDSIHDTLGRTGRAAMGMAVRGRWIALAYEHLNRLATDGASGGLPLKGSPTGFVIQKRGYGGYGRGKQVIGPTSLAFSPDGRTLYLTGYLWRQRQGHSGCFHVVHKVDFQAGEEMSVFVGSRARDGYGRDNRRLAVPTSVACDPSGNVYVSDFLNDRVQVFKPSGEHLASIQVNRPAKVLVHQKTGEIFVFSWAPIGIPGDAWRAYDYDPDDVKETLTRFSPYPQCRRIRAEPFPLGPAGHSRVFQMGQLHEVELDSWAPGPGPVFWVISRKFVATRADHRILYIDHRKVMAADKWAKGMRIVTRKDGKWVTLASFGERAKKVVKRLAPIKHNIQHLYVNPTTGKLYVGEADSGPTIKAFKRLAEIDPATGAIRFVQLPFNALDAAFDLNGLIYLRTTDVVVRYDPRTWREVPWDYGEELPQVTCGIYGRSAPATSGLIMPTVSPVCFHQGGMSVSPRGHLAVACANRPKGRKEHHDFTIFGNEANYGKPYQPRMYPGREESSTSCSVHVWDRHGKLIHEDAVWGLPQLDGVHIDREDNLYVMATPTRVLGGKRYFNRMSETLAKFAPGRAKLLHASRGRIALPDSLRPRREPELDRGGLIWVEGAEWFYGGVGYAGFNTPHAGGGCACWFSRFALDYFARSIAPEQYQYRVAVVDSAGNLILRIGRYGNVDDGTPLVTDGGPAGARRIGGDEVSLFHACFVGTHTDRRIFISDLGNARIVCVKLDYHATERVALKDVPAGRK
jgi:hypothetical protein